MLTRKRLYEIIEVGERKDTVSAAYDYFMMACIVLSIIPLAFKENLPVFHVIEVVTVCVFIIDYVLRLVTADFKYPHLGARAFLRYPFSLMAIIDLLSILPAFLAVSQGVKALRVIRLLKILRIFRGLRYSKSFNAIAEVFRSSKESLIAVCTLAIGYILIAALVVFTVEPETFDTFFDAVYWATVSLTTVGYGDIYPVSTAGRVITMVSSLFGIAIVALPAGIITAGYMSMLEKKTGKTEVADAQEDGSANGE